MKQQPNDRFFFIGPPIGLHVYNLGGVFKRWSKSAPVLFDEGLAASTAKQLQLHYFNQGYFNAQTEYKTDFFSKKKVKVNYHIYPGERYYIGEFTYEINSPQLYEAYQRIKNNSLINVGSPIDFNAMDAERSRLIEQFRNAGFFNFSRDLINFEVDTSRSATEVRVKLIISDRTVRSGNQLKTIHHKRAKIEKIEVEIQPSIFSKKRSSPITQDFKNIEINTSGDFYYRPRVFYDVILVDTGQIYREVLFKETYRLFNKLRLFSSTEVNVEEIEFSENNDTNFTPLVARITVTPNPKSGFGTQLEVTNTSGNRGFQSSLSWMRRNVFNGGEIFNIKLNGSIEAQVIGEQTVDNTFNTFEIGGEFSLQFPRFLLPFNTLNLVPKRMEPNSRVLIGASRQNRIEFDRIIYRLGLGYSWRESPRKTHQVELMEFNYVRLLKIDPSFFEQSNFLFGFRNVYISATRHVFVYNTQKPEYQKRAFFFRGMTELAGSSSWIIDQLSDLPKDSLGVSQLFGVSYAQYAKLEADFRYYRYFTKDQVFASRVFAGYTRGFGNSFDPTYGFQPPFERRYFIGGSNDHRAFPPYRVGPGNNPNARGQFNTAPIKILLNFEYRFPFYKALKGAVFVDLGNIFYEDMAIPGTNQRVSDLVPDQVLNMRNLYEAMAVGTGIGLRYDFTFVIVRLDLATAIHNPILPEGSRWVKEPWRIKSYVFNAAIGYPF